jgi:hypothetical protein
MKIKPPFFLLLFSAVLITGCKKDEKPVYSGTMTIDNVLTLSGTGAYIGSGFSVPTGKKVSTLQNPQDVIIIQADPDNNNNVRKLYFACNNYLNAFFLYGQYSNEAGATIAFDNILSFSDPQWQELGDSVKANQVWLFRTSSDTFAKIRVISTLGEKRGSLPYGECTFEWVYQPDGTPTFPGK